MSIQRLDVHNIRNIVSLTIEPSAHLNLIIGPNGSGKTSLLESMYLLSTGRSFRTRHTKQIISFNQPNTSIFCLANQATKLGITKHISNETHIRINEEKKSLLDLAQQLPMIILEPSSYQLLTAGPKLRRQFIDWGTFHVEHGFITAWKQYNQALKHRNAALRQGRPDTQITIWNNTLTTTAAMINHYRQQYVADYIPVLTQLLNQIDFTAIHVDYWRGWSKDLSLAEALIRSLPNDRKLGYTQHGPHQADLKFKLVEPNLYAKDILSRGKLKLLVLMIKLAQGILLYQLSKKSCIYLLDDLSAELDNLSLKTTCSVLSTINAQVFITSLHPHVANVLQSKDPLRLFHVEQGEIIK